MYPADILQMSLRKLGWSRPATECCRPEGSRGSFARLLPGEFPSTGTAEGCWLSWILSANVSGNRASGSESNTIDNLTPLGRENLSSIVRLGWTLRDRWPRVSGPILKEWLGDRLYFASSSCFSQRRRISCIVSSRLGRNQGRFLAWPFMLDWALRTIQRDRSVLLRAPHTTLSAAIDHFVEASGIPSIHLAFSSGDSGGLQQISDWLTANLRAAASPATLAERICVSPAFQSVQAVDGLSGLPVQDRAVIAMADRVLAISVRSKGTIARLLDRRLRDERFPPASVLVAIAGSQAGRCGKSHRTDRTSSTALRLLSQGAVGWVMLHDWVEGLRDFSRCRTEPDRQILPGCAKSEIASQIQGCQPIQPSSRVRRLAVQQLCAPARKLWNHAVGDWPYLCHCTRGCRGALPQETPAAYFDRLWRTGFEQPGDPLWTLVRILREQRLRGTTWMTRGALPSVSLSEVPLKELLGRRRYQTHLGRWDWEPYGLCIQKRVLDRARPVIYGLSSDYEQLSNQDRVYFQPVDSKYDWKQECEWRVLGDLDLSLLPSEAVTVFVRSQLEAVQLARESRFPVLWTEGIHA